MKLTKTISDETVRRTRAWIRLKKDIEKYRKLENINMNKLCKKFDMTNTEYSRFMHNLEVGVVIKRLMKMENWMIKMKHKHERIIRNKQT